MILDRLKTMLEAIRTVTVIRDNKPVKIQQSSKPNYKIVNGEEVKMSMEEILNRQKAAKKAQLKNKGQQDNINDKRKASMETREELELDKENT